MDLTTKDVAELLSLSEETIHLWLAEGKIPAYRLNDEYRFNRFEIEDWLMQRTLDVPHDSGKVGRMHYSLYRAINKGQVLGSIQAASKKILIHKALQQIAPLYELDAEVLTDLFMDREERMATALGHGIGVPHTRDFLLPTHYDVIIIVYPESPIEYGALDGEPIHTLFFLFASEDTSHLNLLAKISHFCAREKNRIFLKGKPSKEHLLDYIKAWEAIQKISD